MIVLIGMQQMDYSANETVTNINKQKSEKVRELQKEFVKNWLSDNQPRFIECMNEIYHHDPRTWAKMYIEHEKIVMPKQTDVNVKHSINKDFQDLFDRSRTMASIENKQDNNIVFAEYEELKEPEKETSKIDFSKLKGVVLDAEILERG